MPTLLYVFGSLKGNGGMPMNNLRQWEGRNGKWEMEVGSGRIQNAKVGITLSDYWQVNQPINWRI
jgi:hypothetical protein